MEYSCSPTIPLQEALVKHTVIPIFHRRIGIDVNRKEKGRKPNCPSSFLWGHASILLSECTRVTKLPARLDRIEKRKDAV